MFIILCALETEMILEIILSTNLSQFVSVYLKNLSS